MTNDQNPEVPTLAGLELKSEKLGPSPLRDAVAATLKALDEGKLLEPRHALPAQLALELADAVTAGTRSGRASAAAMAAAQLLATWDRLPEPVAAGADAQWDKFVHELEKLSQ